MAGRIKAGEGTLIGNAGEFYVAAELLKRGIIAALAPRNAPAFDILAARRDRTVRIRVKTKSEEYTDWQWAIRKDGTIFQHLSDGDDFTVLVNLTKRTQDLQFFIIPTATLNKWLVEVFDHWLKKPGLRGRPHSPTNKKRHLNSLKFKEKLSKYLHNWDLLWERVGRPTTA